tara:strand:+ start:825 stop:1037 length:213 start_codon:yes stop_codon:yes gene_type:complete
MPKYTTSLGTWLMPAKSFEPIYDVQIKGLASLVKLRSAVRSLKKQNKALELELVSLKKTTEYLKSKIEGA